jgi:predicted DNA-binding antitoxin AbrB/MazE fold protein
MSSYCKDGIKLLAMKAVVKNGVIKPLDAIDLPEEKEIVVYITEEREGEEYSDGTEEEWQRFSLHSFINTGDEKDEDWDDFFNYNIDDDVKENMEIREGILCKGRLECRQLET